MRPPQGTNTWLTILLQYFVVCHPQQCALKPLGKLPQRNNNTTYSNIIVGDWVLIFPQLWKTHTNQNFVHGLPYPTTRFCAIGPLPYSTTGELVIFSNMAMCIVSVFLGYLKLFNAGLEFANRVSKRGKWNRAPREHELSTPQMIPNTFILHPIMFPNFDFKIGYPWFGRRWPKPSLSHYCEIAFRSTLEVRTTPSRTWLERWGIEFVMSGNTQSCDQFFENCRMVERAPHGTKQYQHGKHVLWRNGQT